MSVVPDVYERIEELRRSADLIDRVVAVIWDDVTSRRGWRQTHDTFDPDVQLEIVETWRAKVRAAISV